MMKKKKLTQQIKLLTKHPNRLVYQKGKRFFEAVRIPKEKGTEWALFLGRKHKIGQVPVEYVRTKPQIKKEIAEIIKDLRIKRRK
jgi:hypothetical protein